MRAVLRAVGTCLVVICWSLAVLLVPSSASWADPEQPESSSSSSPSQPPSSSSPEPDSNPEPDPDPDPEPLPPTQTQADPVCTTDDPCVMEPSKNTISLLLLLGGVSTFALLGLFVGSFGRR